MFSVNIVGLIADYAGLSDECGAWRTTVEFLKREAGETKFGSVPFHEGLIQLLGANQVGYERMVESERHLQPPPGLLYRQVIRAQPECPNDLFFLVPRGVRAAEDGTDWGVK